MAVDIEEQRDSRAGNGTSSWHSKQTRHFIGRGSNDPQTVIAQLFLETGCPASITCPVNPPLLLYRGEVRYAPLNPAQTLWDLYCDYVDPETLDEQDQKDTGSYTFSISTTGGTARITSSLETVQAYCAAGAAAPAGFAAKKIPNFKQTIGVTREGDVQGCDIVVPACKFQIEYRQPKATITWAYTRTVEAMTGTVNDDTFYGRSAGEVLFLGGNGRQGTASDPTWSYEFLRLPNVASQTIGDILNVAKRGHDYLWVLYEDAEDADAVYTVKKPKIVYIERVYLATDFATLGIGE